MTKEELFEKLDIETPADFAYFEQIADLLEDEGDMPLELFSVVLSEVDSETMGTLLENYFEDLTGSIPDDADDLMCLIEEIKSNLIILSQNFEESREELIEELYYFKNWMHKEDGAMVDKGSCTLVDAVAEYRVEKLGGAKHTYAFPSVNDYDIKEMKYSLGKYSKVDILKENEDNTEDFYN